MLLLNDIKIADFFQTYSHFYKTILQNKTFLKLALYPSPGYYQRLYNKLFLVLYA